ncbi:MAG: hypothetical protein SWH61_04325 [Thermodesulfobacteriota bacterium]|nr:hypothetical protein [Thermodesulfobacteriota bacterium]
MNISGRTKSLSQTKIYFGHQSVGFNIVDGLKDILQEDEKLSLNIRETSNPEDFSKPVFAHSRNGENRDWQSKIDDFQDKMEGGLGNVADIAFFKFCYVDVTEKTDVAKLFASYTQAMEKLEKKFPDTTFLYATVPLQTANTSWKTWIKKIIGKNHIWEYADNIRRNEFNSLIRQTYSDSGRLFDIARAESSFPDGNRELFKKDGNRYEALVPAFTYDGGHLNEQGRKVVAAHLLSLLERITQK